MDELASIGHCSEMLLHDVSKVCIKHISIYLHAKEAQRYCAWGIKC
jgi:hypothetical protein